MILVCEVYSRNLPTYQMQSQYLFIITNFKSVICLLFHILQLWIVMSLHACWHRHYYRKLLGQEQINLNFHAYIVGYNSRMTNINVWNVFHDHRYPTHLVHILFSATKHFLAPEPAFSRLWHSGLSIQINNPATSPTNLSKPAHDSNLNPCTMCHYCW